VSWRPPQRLIYPYAFSGTFPAESAPRARPSSDRRAGEVVLSPREDELLRLLGRARAGEARALDELIARVQPFMAALVRGACPDRVEAEDVLQESLLELCRSLPDLKEDRALLPWLRQIVQHKAADRGRRRAVRREVSLESAADRHAGEAPEFAALEGAERRRAILAALAALPEEDREMLGLRHEAGLSLEEIALATGLTPRAVESRLFRARRSLRARLSGGAGR